MHVCVKSKYVCSNFRFHLLSVVMFGLFASSMSLLWRVHGAANHDHFKAVEILLLWGTDIEARDYVIRLFYK